MYNLDVYNLDEYVPWTKVSVEQDVFAMTVSQQLEVAVLACIGKYEGKAYMGDLMQVYKMPFTSLQDSKREFIHKGGSCVEMLFTAENLLVMCLASGKVCLMDINAECQVGIVGNPDGYVHMPVCIATKPGYIVVGYIVVGYDTLEKCQQGTIRVFCGSGTTWTLHHEIEKPVSMHTTMSFFPSTGMLGIVWGRPWPDIHLHLGDLKWYHVDPWELTENVYVGDADHLAVLSVDEYDGEWFVLREDGSLSALVDKDKNRKYKGRLSFDSPRDFDTQVVGYGLFSSTGAIIGVHTDAVSGLLAVYAHPDIIAMASMSELRVAWMTVVAMVITRAAK